MNDISLDYKFKALSDKLSTSKILVEERRKKGNSQKELTVWGVGYKFCTEKP